MEFMELFDKMREDEQLQFDRHIEQLEKERPILEVMHKTFAIIITGEQHTPGGGYVSRPFGSGTHDQPAAHYQMKEDETETDVHHIILQLRNQAAAAGLEIHLKKMVEPEQYFERWTYQFEWFLPDGAVADEAVEKIGFSFHIWMHNDGVCRLVEDGWKDPEKKFKVECTADAA